MYLNELQSCSKEEIAISYFNYFCILLKYKYISNVRALMNNNYVSLYWMCKKISPTCTPIRENVEQSIVDAQGMIDSIPSRQSEKKRIICERLDSVIVALEPITEDYDSVADDASFED